MEYGSKWVVYSIDGILSFIQGRKKEMKVKVTFEYELEDKQREQFEDVRAEEGEEAAFYFIEDLVRKEIEFAEVVEAEYKED